MTFEDMERLLGKDTVAAVRSSVEKAYVSSRRVEGTCGPAALQELLITMLASVVRPTKDVDAAKDCIRKLRQALKP